MANPHALGLFNRIRDDGLLVLLESVAETHNVTLMKVLSGDRHKSVAKARAAMYVALSAIGKSSTEVGRYLDRDHSTVLVALAKAREAASVAEAG